MKAQVLTGSKHQIAQSLAQIEGEVHEAIVFIDERSTAPAELSPEDIFAEMDPFVVQAGGADYSRQALYTRLEGE